MNYKALKNYKHRQSQKIYHSHKWILYKQTKFVCFQGFSVCIFDICFEGTAMSP